MADIEELEKLDKLKTKVLKYIMFKKRTEREIRRKFATVEDQDLLDDVIENLKEIGYIDDSKYVLRAINEFMALNNLSIKEIKYKLMSKGVKNDIIEDYISENYDILMEYEIKSAKKIAVKKSNLEKQDLKMYLMKKGYKEESIREAI